MLTVDVHPDCLFPHVSQVLAGLHGLQREGRLRLRYLTAREGGLPRVPDAVLWTVVTERDRGVSRVVCFDMQDGGRCGSETLLETCDVWFKRSFSSASTAGLPPVLAARVRPFGLNYVCRPERESLGTAVRRAVGYVRHRAYGPADLRAAALVGARYAYVHARAHHAGLGRTSGLFGLPLRPSEFEAPPDVETENLVLFQSRVWETHRADTQRVNEMRAETVRSLRSRFGDRFVGGLTPSPYAQERYPDLVTPFPSSKPEFVKLVRRCAIAVTTAGLWDSIGWRLAEYLAASRCIVSERPTCALPVPLEEGRHFLTFQTPEECVRACERLLADDTLRERLRRAAYAYYLAEVHPTALIRKRLQSVVGEPPRLGVPEDDGGPG